MADPQAYALYDGQGRPATVAQVLAASEAADVILFGEQHNQPVAHWLEVRLAHLLFEHHLRLDMGLEMFEADQQPTLDSLWQELLTPAELPRHTRVWPNYATDYAPLVRFATDHSLRLWATNVPRALARLVSRQGLAALDSLPPARRTGLPPLPVAGDTTLPGYRSMIASMGGHGSMPGISPLHLVQAQALKDATMAHRLLQALRPRVPFFHVHGAYHTDRHGGQGGPPEGIAHFLLQARPTLRLLTLSCVVQKNTQALLPEHLGRADYVIVIPADFPASY